MIVLNSNTNSNSLIKKICDGAGCSKEATQAIIEKVGDMGTITLHLCKDCKDSFCASGSNSLRETKKKESEQQVARPASSNSLNQAQPLQQHGVLLDD